GQHIRLGKGVACALPPVWGDRAKIRQVLLNVLSNAIKFTPGGRASVGVRLDGDAIHVAVSDTGVGIRKDDLGRLFEPFERLENSDARAGWELGRGAAIRNEIEKLERGRVRAEGRAEAGCHVAGV